MTHHLVYQAPAGVVSVALTELSDDINTAGSESEFVQLSKLFHLRARAKLFAYLELVSLTDLREVVAL